MKNWCQFVKRNFIYLSHRTNDVKSAARCRLLNVDRENLGRCYVIFGEQKNQERNIDTPSRSGKYFKWIIHRGRRPWSAIIEFGFIIWRILQFLEGVIHLGLRPRWIPPSLICRILHILDRLIQSWLIIIQLSYSIRIPIFWLADLYHAILCCDETTTVTSLSWCNSRGVYSAHHCHYTMASADLKIDNFFAVYSIWIIKMLTHSLLVSYRDLSALVH